MKFLSLQLDKDWFLPAEVSLRKRDHIRKLIHRIAEDNALKDPSADKYFQSCDIDEGDSSVRVMEKESCCGVKLESSDDHIKGQQSPVAMLEERSIDKSASDKFFQRVKLMMPIHQFSNLSLPMEVIHFQEAFLFPYAYTCKSGTKSHFPPVQHLCICCVHMNAYLHSNNSNMVNSFLYISCSAYLSNKPFFSLF